MSETTCIHKWDWRKYGPCTMCGPAPIIATDCTATRKTPVDIAEIIEQVRALQHEKSLMVSDERAAGRYDAIGDVIEILERYR